MPWITPERKETRDRLTIKVDVAVLQQLENYAAFVDSSQSYVVTEILRAVFGRDKDFQTWLQTRTGSYDRSYVRSRDGSHDGSREGSVVDAAIAGDAAASVSRRRRRGSTVTSPTPSGLALDTPDEE